jgi:predicted RNase H-like nuclease
MQRSATLPYKVLAGVEPCPGGWLVVTGRLQGITLLPQPPQVFATLVDVLDHKPGFDVIALHAPIGLRNEPGARACDREARRALGWPSSGAVLATPTRAALAPGTYEEARAANGGALGAVTWALMPRIREVDAAIQPYWQRTVFEVHPELGFHRLNGDAPLRFSKRDVIGAKERRTLLETKFPGAERVIDLRVAGARTHHVVDALADLWTARRIASKAVQRRPADPEWDDHGLRMEIVS